jgi:hypothetical protein
MSDDEKLIDNKTIIKIIISIVIALGVRFSNFGEKKFIAFITAVICAFLIFLNFYQETCSDYQCSDGYVNNESKKDTECGGIADFTCNSVDRDTCCNKSVNCEGSWSNFGECSVECGGGTQTRTYTVTIQPQYGGTPCPTSPDSQPCNTQACENIQGGNDASGGNEGDDTGVVANATCSTVSGNCPDGYLYKIDSADIECNGPTCDVGISGTDLETCCEQRCSAPSSMPTGFTGNLPATLPVGVGDITGVQCDANYNGTPRYTCNGVGEEYILDGCGQPIDCVVNSTQYSSCSGDCGSRGTKTATYTIGVEAQYGGNPCPTTEEIPCDTRACATCSSYQCPEDYIPKSGVAEVSCGNYDCNIDNRDTCCEVGQLPEEQDTELPNCSEVAEPNKLPETTVLELVVNDLKDCSDACAAISTCQSFSYSENESGNPVATHPNCFLGSSIATRDPDGIQAIDYYSWSFYPKC